MKLNSLENKNTAELMCIPANKLDEIKNSVKFFSFSTRLFVEHKTHIIFNLYNTSNIWYIQNM